jgi:cell division septation protein DedD
MEEGSWRSQNFTLLIFAGVVVLCSIFFVLGMLVGRSQGVGASEVASAPEVTVSEEPEPEELDLRFYEAVEESQPSPLEGSGTSSPVVATRAAEPENPSGPASNPTPALAITLQIAALSNADQAEALRQEISDRGLPAFVLRPAPGDQPPLHRVQVGPFNDESEVARVRAVLESEGYEPIVRN